MLVRTSRTLALSATAEGVEGINFLSGTPFTINADVLSILSGLHEWEIADELVATFGLSNDQVSALLQLGLLVAQDTPEATREAEFEEKWQWGLPAAALHFSLQDRAFTSVDDAEVAQVERLGDRPQPPLTESNDAATIVSLLPNPQTADNLLQTMARRRTVRESTDLALSLASLSTLLFSGLGITGHTQNKAGKLPLKMTPSGGARNPYEGFVYARRVEGLEPGIHHYSASEHTLGLVDREPELTPAQLVGDQPWVDEAAAIVFLVAHLDRTMWKYDDPNAYRVVFIEAGHIFQNMMLVATQAGWSACPTAAISRRKTLSTLRVDDSVVVEPVYALALMDPPGGLLSPECALLN